MSKLGWGRQWPQQCPDQHRGSARGLGHEGRVCGYEETCWPNKVMDRFLGQTGDQFCVQRDTRRSYGGRLEKNSLPGRGKSQCRGCRLQSSNGRRAQGAGRGAQGAGPEGRRWEVRAQARLHPMSLQGSPVKGRRRDTSGHRAVVSATHKERRGSCRAGARSSLPGSAQ